MEMTPVHIDSTGENYVLAWLRNRGYVNIVRKTRQAGSIEIRADGPAHPLVEVKTAVFPNSPKMPSFEEIRKIRARAVGLGRVAYLAQVLIDSSGALATDIAFRRL